MPTPSCGVAKSAAINSSLETPQYGVHLFDDEVNKSTSQQVSKRIRPFQVRRSLAILVPALLFTATVATADLLPGTSGDDHLDGTEQKETIWGDKGADTIDGKGGADTIRGGEGADTLTGGAGNDIIDESGTLTGSSGPDGDEDTIHAEDGEVDTIFIGPEDTIADADDNDKVRVKGASGGFTFTGTFTAYQQWLGSQPLS